MISVVIPVFNRAQMFKASLQSLLDQKDVELQIIIVDDGSIEDMHSIVQEEQATTSTQIVFIRQHNAGAPAARNTGAAKATGTYIIFWDADITADSLMLYKMQEKLDTQPEALFAYSDFSFDNKKMRGQIFSLSALRKNNFITTTSLIRREAFPGFDISLKRFQDWDLWLSIALKDTDGIYIPEFLFVIHTHAKGMSQWMPRWAYMFPFRLLPQFAKRVAQYTEAKEIVRKKHRLMDR